MTSELAIQTEGLVKTFNQMNAIDGITLSIPKGGVYGLLGPNGAGKTTFINIAATLMAPEGGTMTVLGHDVVKEAQTVRRCITLTGQYASIDEDFTAHENLVLIGRLLGLKSKQAKQRADELLDAFGLLEFKDKQIKHYSGGMRRRIDIAASLVVTPELIFLDEPTTGLDPRSRNQVWEIVKELVNVGTTVLLTTQYLEEADQLANQIAVIDRGRVIAQGTPAKLKASVSTGTLNVRVVHQQDLGKARDILSGFFGPGSNDVADPFAISLPVADNQLAAKALLALTESNLEIESFTLGQPSLDEVFLALTGGSPDGGGSQSSVDLSQRADSFSDSRGA